MTEPDQTQNDAPRDEGQPHGGQSCGGRPHDARRRRLLFRATHRGTYENDLLLGGFVRDRLDAFTEADIDELEALMELPDTDLADWLTGRRPIAPEDATPMLLRIRASLIR